ncbi:MAG TPA: DUF5312 family protein [Spirochaetales bacterium]|nr:DUF5312 family protein [Spirochaetales bacterium]
MQNVLEFFRNLFGLGGADSLKRAELRRVHRELAQLRPPVYRPKGNVVLPGLAQGALAFASSIKPLVDVARRSIASTDVRVSQRFFELLIDAELPESEQERKRFFSYDGMKERLANAVRPSEEFEAIGREFQGFLRQLEALSLRNLDAELSEVERFAEICRHDWERLLGLFDPGANLDAPGWRPDFGPVDGETILPELLDVHFVLSGFAFTEVLIRDMLRIVERQAPGSDSSRRQKIEKISAASNKALSGRFSTEMLLLLLRALKRDPAFEPKIGRERRDWIGDYRRRLAAQFEKDRDRLVREQHENAIGSDIEELLRGIEIYPVDGYDEENDAYLRKESPHSFTHIKPLRILKTFVSGIFEPRMMEPIKRVLVEGYFDNKNYQTNLANILYQCERSAGRIAEFEDGLRGTGRISITALRRYIEELRRGKDISSFLQRLVDAINQKAREICEDETGLFQMLGESLGELLADYRRSSPDLVTNIRTLAGPRNRDVMAQLQGAKHSIDVLVKIMRNYTYVKAPAAVPEPGPDLDVDLPLSS